MSKASAELSLATQKAAETVRCAARLPIPNQPTDSAFERAAKRRAWAPAQPPPCFLPGNLTPGDTYMRWMPQQLSQELDATQQYPSLRKEHGRLLWRPVRPPLRRHHQHNAHPHAQGEGRDGQETGRGEDDGNPGIDGPTRPVVGQNVSGVRGCALGGAAGQTDGSGRARPSGVGGGGWGWGVAA